MCVCVCVCVCVCIAKGDDKFVYIVNSMNNIHKPTKMTHTIVCVLMSFLLVCVLMSFLLVCFLVNFSTKLLKVACLKLI